MDFSNEAFTFVVLVAFLTAATLLCVLWDRLRPSREDQTDDAVDVERMKAEEAAWDRYDDELRRGAPRLLVSLAVGGAALYGLMGLLLWIING